MSYTLADGSEQSFFVGVVAQLHPEFPAIEGCFSASKGRFSASKTIFCRKRKNKRAFTTPARSNGRLTFSAKLTRVHNQGGPKRKAVLADIEGRDAGKGMPLAGYGQFRNVKPVKKEKDEGDSEKSERFIAA